MKKLKFVFWGVAVLAAVGFLVSCDNDDDIEVIEGELTLLVKGGTHMDSPNATYPCWSSDGSVIYYVLSHTPDDWNIGQVWSINVDDSSTKMITEYEIREFDISRQGNLCLFYEYEGTEDWIRIMETETWTAIDSVQPVEEAKHTHSGDVFDVKFSYEYSDSNRIFYYLYNEHKVGSHLNKVNLDNSTDEKIVSDCHSTHLATGPGDTLFAFDGNIINLNTGEKTTLEVSGGSLDWNPADPRELLVAGGIKKEVYVCDLDSNKIRRFSVDNEWIFNARYSPDGKRIAVGSQLSISEGGGVWGSIWIFDPEEY